MQLSATDLFPLMKRFVLIIIFFCFCVIAESQQRNVVLSMTETPETVDNLVESVIGEALKYIGTPYRWGGKTPAGFDCAGFTRYIYSKFGVTLSPSAPGQSKEGSKVAVGEISKGDIVLYGARGNKGAVGHVGIVTEVGESGFKFIHASNTGVRISSSNEPYYKSRFIGARRVSHMAQL